MTILYLAHPLESEKYIREWELQLEAKSNIELINPFYDIERDDLDIIQNRKIRYKKLDAKKIVRRDIIKGINPSDGIIAIIDGNLSYGTIQEMVYAQFMKKKVYSVITNGEEYHAWLVYHSDEIFTKLNDLEDFLLNDRKINRK